METKDGIPFAAYFMAESLRATLHYAAHGAAYDDAYGDEDDATRDAARNHTCASKYLPLPILTVAIRPEGSHMPISAPRLLSFGKKKLLTKKCVEHWTFEKHAVTNETSSGSQY